MSKLTALEVSKSRYVFQRNNLQTFRRGLAAEEAFFRSLQGLDPYPSSVMQCHLIPGIGVTPPARLLKVWKCGVGHLDNIRSASFLFVTNGQPDETGGRLQLLEGNKRRKALYAYITGTNSTVKIGLVFDHGPTVFNRITLGLVSPTALDTDFARSYHVTQDGQGIQINPAVHYFFPCPTSPVTMIIKQPRNTPDTTFTVQELYH